MTDRTFSVVIKSNRRELLMREATIILDAPDDFEAYAIVRDFLNKNEVQKDDFKIDSVNETTYYDLPGRVS